MPRTLFSTSSNSSPYPVNVGDVERLISILSGIAVLVYGIKRRSGFFTPILTFLGGALIRRGWTGRCPAYKEPGNDDTASNRQSSVPDQESFHIEKSVQIARSSSEIFEFWRNVENLPSFMIHLQSVTKVGDSISHWVVEGPAGHTIEWDVEIINEHPGEMIAWQTLPGADLQSAGTVRFQPFNNAQTTEVTVILQFGPATKDLGAAMVRLFGESPGKQLEEDLLRLKALLETDVGANLA